MALPVTVLDVPKAPTMADDLQSVTIDLEDGQHRAVVTLSLYHTRCAVGGYRRWWRCPSCHSRRAKLLVWGLSVACRSCFEAPYRSQRRWPRWSKAALTAMAEANYG